MNTRSQFLAVVAAACFLAPFSVLAQTLDFDVLIDSDRSAATGCVVTPSGGATLNGFEHRLRATVDMDSAEVVALERASCAGGAFGAPVPVSGVSVPYPLALNTGIGGADAVELAVARGALGGSNLSQLRLTFVTDNGIGSDVLATTDGSAGGALIVFGLPVQIPALSIWGLGALVLVLLTLAWLAHRRMGRVGAVMAVMLVTTAAWAMSFAVDGDLSDWAGRSPNAQDPSGDATDGSAAIDLVAAFVALDGDVLFFRMDVADTESQAPFAADDGHSTVERSVLEIVAASGLLANDNLGVPDAALTNFGGGDLGGAVTDHAPGSTVIVGADGSLTVNADGSFQFQAETGFEGDYSFQYRIGNTVGDSDATVTIQVQTPPEAVADAFDTATGDQLQVATPGVLVNDSGLPDPAVASFGGGDLGGTVNDNPAGTSVSIAPDGSVAVNADGSLSFTPPTGLTGDFGFDYRIENVAGNAQASITITIEDPPVITSADSHTCEAGAICGFSFTATGFPDPTITINGALPAGVTFNAATESLEGTPGAGTGAEYNLTVTADNGVQSTQNFTLTVHEAPTITSVDNLTCQIGTACNFTFTADGFPDPTFTLPGLPAGLSLDTNTGVLSGTPAAGTGAIHNLTLTAANGIGADDTQAFTLTINEVPTITSGNSLTCQVGDPCNFTFTADGFPDPTFTLPGLPAGLSLDTNTGVLSGTPDVGTGAEHNLTLTATNGVTPDAAQAFTLTINEAPTITSGNSLTCQVGDPCNFTFTADGFPDPTFALPGLPAGLSLDTNTGVLSGTPAAGTGAVHNLTLTAANGIGADDTQAFTLTINEAPTITSGNSLTCQVGDPCNFTFTADGFPDPTFALPGLPAGLSLDTNTGVLSGTPDVGTGAEHNLTLTAANGIGADDTQAFTLTINEAPTITSGNSLTCQAGDPCNFTFTADGFPDPTFALPGLPAGLSLDTNTGVLSGTPDAGTGAIHNLTLTAANGIGADDTQAFTLTINEAPTITSGNSLTCQVGDPCNFTFTADGFPDPTFALPGLPAGLSLDTNTGVLSGTPDVGTGAEHNLTLTAANGIGADDTQAFTLTINEAPTATDDPTGGIPATSSPGSLAYHGSFNTALNVSAADGVLDNDVRGFPQADIVTVSPIGTAGAGSVSLNADGSFSYTPATGFTGIDSFQYCIENTGGNDCATVALAVGERPAAADASYPQTLLGNVGIDTTVNSNFSVAPLASGDAITLGLDSTANGDATLNAAGTFTFNPAAGVTSANGALVYSVSNGFGSVTGTITLPIGADRIWFVDNAAVAGDGRLGTPFNTLAATETAASANGDRIFLFTGSGNYTGGITLLDGQRLLGQGAGQALATIAGITHPTDSVLPATGGTAPVIVNGGGNGVALAANNRIQGFAVGNTSGSGVSGTTFGTLTVADVTIAGTGQALNLDSGSVAGTGFASVSSSSGTRNVSLVTVGGTLNLGGGSLSGASGQAFFVDGGTGTISYTGSIGNTTSRVAEIQNKTGGAVTLSGALTSNAGGTGIRVASNSGGSAITFSGASKTLNTGTNGAVTLTGNTGATISFSNGGLDIDTTSGAGFSATGGGTVIVSGAANTVDSTTGAGVNIANTTIGASGVNLRSVSANGAASAIVLNNTGTQGGLGIQGDGSTAGSGGTIQNTTGNAISLTSTRDVSLNFINISNSGANGIFGSNVTGFTLNGANVTGNGDQVNEGGLRFDPNLLGTAAISNSTISGSAEHNMEIINTSGVLNALTISNSTISTNSAALGADGLLLETRNAAQANVVVTGSTFDDNQSDGIQISAINDSTASLTVNDTTFTSSLDGSPAGSVGARGIVLSASTNADLTFDIGSTTSNLFENFSPNIGEEAINVTLISTSTASALMSGRINNNTFTNSGGAVGIDLRGDGALVMEIDSNTANTSRQAIDVITGDQAGDAATADLTITNNSLTVAGTTANPNNEAIGWLGDRDTVSCLNIRGNAGVASGTRDDIILDDFTDPAGAVRLESGPADCGGGACGTSEAHLLANNTITDAVSSAGLVTPGTCATVP